ncbi:hypothetical protein BIV57_14590 [Mangrovactinospora gilvigrisea]|uniref:(+)RNA virus helicase C-terminal domain-containing protein n=1 Tax=Mangrovactinospora gilvigrisea TaxID=1428644 RepID=A0A1J7C5C9_9ACTN|nr:hypothetical protein [Mangrovactinospora gilvigrisea]OIV36760.1 hypothetical protein BIV57_14590 [Mangrovactinospora gilvigrisea]
MTLVQVVEVSGVLRPWGVCDLRGAARPPVLAYPHEAAVVVSGVPGAGKSTLIARAVSDPRATVLDAGLPGRLRRPAVRARHYARLLRARRAPAPLVVHDCGAVPVVRRLLARRRATHLIVVDAADDEALGAQRGRGRPLAPRVFDRHRAAMGALLRDAARGLLPDGTASLVLLDRPAAAALPGISFAGTAVPTGRLPWRHAHPHQTRPE